jgi:hypothetical protein
MSRGISFLKLAGCLAASVILTTACGGPLRYMVPGTEKAPGADAEVVAVVNPDQSTTKFDVRATYLPPPGRIAEGTDSYVVWVRRDSSQPWTRVGTLKYDPNARTGEMREVSVPETAFELAITAESGPVPGSPSNDVVFAQVVERG